MINLGQDVHNSEKTKASKVLHPRQVEFNLLSPRDTIRRCGRTNMPENSSNPTILEEIGAVINIGGILLFSWLLRPWYSRWGVPKGDDKRPLPGDGIVTQPMLEVTRAIEIQAPPERVWPWLAQLGQEKGGLYTYQRLENLAGCRIANASRIVPEWQNPLPGDAVRLGPKGYPFFRISSIEPKLALVMQACDPATELPGPASWVFVIERLGNRTCRLWTRSRNGSERTFVNLLIWRVVVEPIHFVMERRMLIGIKQRAESI